MPPCEREAFERALVDDFSSIAAALSAVDLAKSEAARSTDRDNIFAAVRSEVGFHELNIEVTSAFRQWLLAAGTSALLRAEAEDELELGPVKQPLALRNQLAVLCREHGDWPEAERLFAEELEACEAAAHGNESDADWLIALNNLAAILVRRGRYDEAEPLLSKALSCREHANGPSAVDTLVSCGNLASLLRYKGELVRAERLATRVYRGRVQELGDEHVQTAIAACDLSLCKLDRADFSESIRLARLALKGARAAVGVRNLSCLNIQLSLALILASSPGESTLDEAERLAADVLAAYEQQSGREHADTLLASATRGLARVGRDGLLAAEARRAGMGEMRSALEALSAPPHELPRNHWSVRRIQSALESAERADGLHPRGRLGE